MSVGVAVAAHRRTLRPNTPRPTARWQLSRRRRRFTYRHVPQQPTAWTHAGFPDSIAGIGSRVLARIVAVTLTAMTEECGVDNAARLLGLHEQWPRYGERTLRTLAVDPVKAGQLQHGLEQIAAELDATTELVDYAHRRHALRSWSMPQPDWDAAVALLAPRQPTGAGRAVTDWGALKHDLASTIVWLRVTQGDLAVAPLPTVPADHQRQHRSRVRSVLWRANRNSRTYRHYEDLLD